MTKQSPGAAFRMGQQKAAAPAASQAESVSPGGFSSLTVQTPPALAAPNVIHHDGQWWECNEGWETWHHKDGTTSTIRAVRLIRPVEGAG